MAVKRVGEVQGKQQVAAKPAAPTTRLAALKSAAATVSSFDEPRRQGPISINPAPRPGTRPVSDAAVPQVNGVDRLRYMKLLG